MEHLALYRKWRPRDFAGLVGQEHISRTLLNAMAQDRLAHAYLFCGPRGTGKTSTARLLAKALNCQSAQAGEPCNRCTSCEEISAGHSLDVVELDAASNRGIDDARELREQVRFSASGGRYRIFIIDEFHMLTHEAFNALLKTLEEPPPNVIFVLATTEPHKVLATIVSRCQRFDFQRIALPALMRHLQHVAAAEQIGVSAQALEAIARKAAGGLRDALSLLDQVSAMAVPGSELPDALVYQILGLIDESALFALAEALLSGQLEALLTKIQDLLALGHEALQIVQELIQLLRHLTLFALPPARMEELGVPSHLVVPLKRLGATLSQGQVISLMTQLVKTADRLHRVTQPEIWLEADLIQLCLQIEPVLLQRLEQLERRLDQGGVTPPTHLPAVREPDAQPGAALAEPVSFSAPTTPDFEPGAAPAPPTAPPPQMDTHQLWQRFVRTVEERSKPLSAAVRDAHLLTIDPERRYWLIHVESSFHRLQLEKHLKPGGKLETLLQELMGQPYQLYFEESSATERVAPAPVQPRTSTLPLPKPPNTQTSPFIPSPPVPTEQTLTPQTPESTESIAPTTETTGFTKHVVEAMSEPSVAPEDLIGYLENAAEIFKGKVIYPIS